MKEMIEKAEKYILDNGSLVNPLYKPILHFSARVGWINDPNGFIYDGENYHLFYQYYPYDSLWGPMHWGHAKSNDLISWEHLPIALAPSEPYDSSGIFSGTSIIENNQFSLYYTGHVDRDAKVEQTQCIAFSNDGLNFTKYENNPLLSSIDMPNDSIYADFRDPKIIKRDNEYILLVASRTIDYVGQILIYSSLDGLNFDYKNRIVLQRFYGDIVECPDLFHIDNKDILVFSTQKAILSSEVQNSFSVFAFIGEFDLKQYQFIKEYEQVLDYGFDFYAPQIAFDGQNHVLIAWMNSWERSMPTHLLNHGWAGSMTLPRVLKLSDSKIVQSFPTSLLSNEKRVMNEASLSLISKQELDLVVSTTYLVEFEVKLKDTDVITLKVLNDNKHYLNIELNGITKVCSVNRENAYHMIHTRLAEDNIMRKMSLSSSIKCSILVDKSSVELLINGKSMTNLFYSNDKSNLLTIDSKENIALINFRLFNY